MRAVKPRIEKTRAKAMTEAQIQKAILAAFHLQRRLAWRLNSGGALISNGEGKGFRKLQGSPPGTPDIIVHVRGSVFGFLEVKRPGGKLREAQEEWFEQAKADGVLCAVATSVQEAQSFLADWLSYVG